ncbi:CBO0543 family protein [Halalkalibacter sp. AB-rgal2]|uniref:CBO0543 family protein n=1 Tax=Halalkalibacter sp. AB-rgal2 TaxID=3242695 RepID=UPI00359E0677
MKEKTEQKILWGVLVTSIISLIYLLKKPSIKDWLLVYFMNGFSNVFIDAFFVSKDMLSYPTRLFPKILKGNFLFDIIVYPTIMVYYNQVTRNDSVFPITVKIFLFTIPMLLIELWAVQNTSLIRWKKGWTWKHTFISTTLKSLLNRLAIGVIRKIDANIIQM